MRIRSQLTCCAALLLLVSACDSSSSVTKNTVNSEIKSTQTQNEVVMYKSPNCECCTGWAEHLRKAGFQVIEKKSNDMMAVKKQYGVPDKLASCHTALVDGYIIEGHVPAADVERLLKERPNIVGLTAPGMPMHSPGMQAAGKAPHGYDVFAFNKDGKVEVFTHY